MAKKVEMDLEAPGNISLGASVCSNVKGLINKDDLSMVVKEQKAMLEQLEKINQMLINCNNISEKQYSKVVLRFQQHTAVLRDMKKNLQYVHSHIRQLKATLHEKHPQTRSLSTTSGSNKEKPVTVITGLDNNSDVDEPQENIPAPIPEIDSNS